MVISLFFFLFFYVRSGGLGAIRLRLFMSIYNGPLPISPSIVFFLLSSSNFSDIYHFIGQVSTEILALIFLSAIRILIFPFDLYFLSCPIGWGCRIHRLYLCRRVRPPPPTAANECPRYDTKQSDGEVPIMLELWEMRSTRSLPTIPDQPRSDSTW